MSLPAVLAVLYDRPPEGTRNVGAVAVLRVLTAIADDADDDARGYFPARSLARLAADLDVSKRAVQNAVRALVDQGRIVKVADAIPRVSGAVYDLIVTRPLVRGIRTNSYGGSAPTDDETRTGDPHQLVQDSYGDPPAHPSYPVTPPVVPPVEVEGADLEPVNDSGGVDERIPVEQVRAILEANGAARRLVTRDTVPGRGVGADGQASGTTAAPAHTPPTRRKARAPVAVVPVGPDPMLAALMGPIVHGRRVVDTPPL